MIQFAMPKRALAVAALAVTGAQAGHLLAYQLQFGGRALQVQSSGTHAYFPVLIKTSLGAVAIALVAGLLMVGAARLVCRGRSAVVPEGPPFISLLATLFTLQLAWFVGQEVAESLFAGLPPASPSSLLLWGMVGQLPTAVAGTAALRWLWARVEAAASELAAITRVAIPAPAPAPLALVAVHASDMVLMPAHTTRSTFVKRGPPLSFSKRAF
jgi:hypothetical protein